ncbi:uncharacterized protein LOC109805631 [Cajanus cajan]|uniref:uncharacterized protein LOC109805631 n=1 Tax=Cajanus cajan TaxID=3821 RepID=UPI00098D9A06|nr:uncharacterized protein LOC109805631 [Cajanus cajan]
MLRRTKNNFGDQDQRDEQGSRLDPGTSKMLRRTKTNFGDQDQKDEQGSQLDPVMLEILMEIGIVMSRWRRKLSNKTVNLNIHNGYGRKVTGLGLGKRYIK